MLFIHHIWQSSHRSGCQKISQCVQHSMKQWQGYKPGNESERSQHPQIQQPGIFEEKKHSKPEEGWSPIQVTQPRHNLQVSFHQYINWSTVKVIQTKLCMYTLRITLGQSFQTGSKTERRPGETDCIFRSMLSMSTNSLSHTKKHETQLSWHILIKKKKKTQINYSAWIILEHVIQKRAAPHRSRFC